MLTSAGHANFLDVLVSELNISDDENEVPSPLQEQSPLVSNGPDKSGVEDGYENREGDSSSDDGWQEDDSSDDEYHTLVRTVSGRLSAPAVHVIAEERADTKLTTATRGNYFHIDTPGSTGVTAGDVVAIEEVGSFGEDFKKDAIVIVALVSPTMTPLASPTDEESLGSTG